MSEDLDQELAELEEQALALKEEELTTDVKLLQKAATQAGSNAYR